MTYENFISFVEHPEQLTDAHIAELKELIDKFPYFGIARWLYLKSLKESNSIYFGEELKKTAIFSPNRRNLYYFIHSEELETKSKRERMSIDGSYFDMIEKIKTNNDDENQQSLRSLAEKFKAARQNYTSGK